MKDISRHVYANTLVLLFLLTVAVSVIQPPLALTLMWDVEKQRAWSSPSLTPLEALAAGDDYTRPSCQGCVLIQC